MKKLQCWKTFGLIIKPKNKKWSKTHCMLPTPYKLSENKYRIFYGTRNSDNQSSITFTDIVFGKKIKILNSPNSPSLSHGSLGNFDDNGVLPSSIIKKNRDILMYYIGWQPRVTTRYSLIAGLAVSKNCNKFFRKQQFPILKNNEKEQISILTAPFVLKHKKTFMMWYVSGIKWLNKDYPLYDIKFAKSKDAVNWDQKKISCLKLKKEERALARPYVIYENKLFKMWYSYEKKVGAYKIGYAESKNGIEWKRKDNQILFINKTKGESLMREYPAIIKYKKKKYLLYNGNSYGKEGIFLAKLEDSY